MRDPCFPRANKLEAQERSPTMIIICNDHVGILKKRVARQEAAAIGGCPASASLASGNVFQVAGALGVSALGVKCPQFSSASLAHGPWFALAR